MEDLGSVIPGWDSIKREAQDLWQRLTGWQKSLAATKADIDAMRWALDRYPQQLSQRRAAILALDAKQKELEGKHVEGRGSLRKILDYLKSWVPGLSSLGFTAPVSVAWAAAALAGLWLLGSAISKHLQAVAAEKALVARLTPEEAKKELERRSKESKDGGIFGDMKSLVVLGIAAAVIIPMIGRR